MDSSFLSRSLTQNQIKRSWINNTSYSVGVEEGVLKVCSHLGWAEEGKATLSDNNLSTTRTCSEARRRISPIIREDVGRATV